MSIRGAQGSRVSRVSASSNGNGNRGGIVGLPIGEATTSTPAAPVLTHTLSPQQQAVVDWVRDGSGSAFVEALAGSGKTFTLIAASRIMQGSVAFTAFNKKIAEEIRTKVGNQRNIRVATFHSFGLAAWRGVASPSLQIDERAKTRMMHDACEVPWPMRSAVSQLVSMAKQSAVGVTWAVDDTERWRSIIDCYDILLRVEDDGRSADDVADDLIYIATRCIAWARSVGKDIIDFDDMLWLPLVEKCAIQQYDWVVVDEMQDTSEVRRVFAGRMLRDGGRSLWAGDRFQSIYGWAGATPNAVDLIVNEFKCATLPLTVTFRCSKAATRLAQTWVPHITAHEDNEEGHVVHRPVAALFSQGELSDFDTYNLTDGVTDPLAPGDAILCRNTKPLVSLAFSLIREGIACHVEGRDIGKSLDRLASKWKVDTVVALVTNLEAYRRRETDRLIAQDARYAIEALNDRIDTLLVITEDCETVQQVRDKISRMFADTDGSDKPKTVLLSTIHRVKGREYDRVFILGWNVYMPSKWARQDWEIEQERNLRYVAVTRCRRDLILTGAFE